MKDIVNNHEFSVVSNAVAAGTSNVNSASVDTANCESVAFLITMGAITSGAVTSAAIEQSSDDGAADTFAALSGSSVTIADTDDNKVFVLEVERPRERYVRVTVDRGTQNAVIESIVAIKGGLRKLPATQPSTVGGTDVVYSPAEA